MNTGRKQLGITLMGFLIVLAVGGVFALFAAKIIPMYTEFSAVKKSMNTLAGQAGVGNLPPDQVWSKLDFIFSTAYVDSVKKNNLQIIKKGKPRIVVTYEVRKPLFYNLDLVGRFSHEEPLRGGR